MTNTTDTNTTDEGMSRREAAFYRFADAHPRYHGGFLIDCFWDDAGDVFGACNIARRADPNDPQWDKVQKKEAHDE